MRRHQTGGSDTRTAQRAPTPRGAETLQSTAGNRAVASLVEPRSVQRDHEAGFVPPDPHWDPFGDLEFGAARAEAARAAGAAGQVAAGGAGGSIGGDLSSELAGAAGATPPVTAAGVAGALKTAATQGTADADNRFDAAVDTGVNVVSGIEHSLSAVADSLPFAEQRSPLTRSLEDTLGPGPADVGKALKQANYKDSVHSLVGFDAAADEGGQIAHTVGGAVERGVEAFTRPFTGGGDTAPAARKPGTHAQRGGEAKPKAKPKHRGTFERMHDTAGSLEAQGGTLERSARQMHDEAGTLEDTAGALDGMAGFDEITSDVMGGIATIGGGVERFAEQLPFVDELL